MSNFPVLSKQSIQLCTMEYMETSGVTDKNLMELSGFACAKEILNYYGPFDKDSIVIYAGPGKNGGDGITTAFFLAPHTKKITICMPIASALTAVSENIKRIKTFCPNVSFTTDLVDGDIYIDAMFGIGLRQKPTDIFEKIIKHINQQANPVISIDVPSGADAESATSSCAVKPDLTLAIGCLKPIHQHAQTETHCGNVVCLDIGLPFMLLQKYAGVQKIAC